MIPLWLALTAAATEPVERPELAPAVEAPGLRTPDLLAFRRGRRVSVAGLFVGWAGVGLAVGGTTLTIGGRGSGPLTDRQLLVATVVSGGGLAILGMGLQVGGSGMQARALPAGPGRSTAQRIIAGSLGGLGAGAAGIVAWRLLDDGPDGLWLPIAAPVAVLGLLGATGLHTVALLHADAELAELHLTVRAGPGWVGLTGRF